MSQPTSHPLRVGPQASSRIRFWSSTDGRL